MESLFFNITDTKYRVTTLFESSGEHIKRVDISNGIFFLDVQLFFHNIDTLIKNLDRMVVFCVAKYAQISIVENISKKEFVLNKNSTNTLIDTQSIDALSLYIIDKIVNIKSDSVMKSIVCEQNILEFIAHRLRLVDMVDKDLDDDELCISKSAKEILLKSYVKPPTITLLAHLCATNESKLKKVFKKVYKCTIYEYTQKLRLERANLLLREQLLNIGEIAKEVGYKYQSHFSKFFYETYGVYPKDLLKKNNLC